MINLLPYDNKRQTKAARHNVILLKCLIFLIFAIVFVTLACWATSSFIKDDTNSQEDSAKTSDDSSNMLSQAETIRSNIATADNAITQRVDYSNVIATLAAAMPTGAIIDVLSTNGSTINTPIQLVLHASADSKGNELKANLDKSDLFTNVTIKSVTPATTTLSGYPYDISLTVLVNKAKNI